MLGFAGSVMVLVLLLSGLGGGLQVILFVLVCLLAGRIVLRILFL